MGRADSGVVDTYELAGMLASPDGRAPPLGPPIESGLAGVVEIRVQRTSTDPILLRGLEGVATVAREDDAVLTRVEGAFGGVAYVTGEEEADPDSVVVTDPVARRILFLDAETLEPLVEEGQPVGTLDIEVRLVGPVIAHGGGDDREILALSGELAATDEHPTTAGGIVVVDADGSNSRCGGDPCEVGVVPLPGAASLIGHQDIANLVYVAGTTPAGQPELWTVEPHFESRGDGSIGMAAFDSTPLPSTPIAMAFDIASTAQGDDQGRLLVSGADGQLVTVDVGDNAFAWRISGVVFGSVLVGLIYLLCATMFGRRRIGLLAAGFVAIDGMSFVMSRISMNDIFVATFIVAGYLAFWQIWSGRWARSRLVGAAARRGPHRPGGGHEVGRLLRAGRPVGPRAGAHRPRQARARRARRAGARHRRGRRAMAVPPRHARDRGPGAGRSPGSARSACDGIETLSALTASAVVLTGVGLAFVLAFDQVEGARNPRNAVEYLFGLLARGAQVGWPVWLMIGVSAVLLLWRAWRSLRDPRSDARWFEPGEMGGFALVMGRRLPGRHPARRLRAELRPVPAARPRLGDRRRARATAGRSTSSTRRCSATTST